MSDLQATLKNTLALRTWGLLKVPFIFFVSPRVEELSAKQAIISIPLRKRNSNHLGSMYFGVLACGADIACGLLAVKLIHESKYNLSIVFKDFKANFLRRPTERTYFVCKQASAIKKMVETAGKKGTRVSQSIAVTAYSPKIGADFVVAEFTLTLSMKTRKVGTVESMLERLFSKPHAVA